MSLNMHIPKDHEKYQQLASKWLDKTISEEELRIFNAWYESDSDGSIAIPESFAQTEVQLEERMLKGINNQIHHTSTYSLWTRISIAASVLLLSGTMLYLYIYTGTDKYQSPLTIHQDTITPGKTGATLTLANGQQIKLSAIAVGATQMEDGTQLSKTVDGQLLYDDSSSANSSTVQHTLSTAKGEMYMMTLPDGTKVWLNAASALTFSPTFNGRNAREVTLTGEAYFEVAKDKKRPFMVITKHQTVTVLGTHFNVSNYEDEPEIKTTLIEGSVKVSNLSSRASVVLKPCQQAVLHGENTQVRQADLGEVLAWRNGDFVFGKDDFEESMRKIERWYNVEFVYEEADIKNLTLDGWISRSSRLSDILRKIELAGNIKFEIKGRRVLLIK